VLPCCGQRICNLKKKNDLQVNGELSQSKHGGVTNINILIGHSVIDLLQQWLQQPGKHTDITMTMFVAPLGVL